MTSFLKKECDLGFFHDNHFIRKKCASCGAYFWTLNPKATICGDQPCVPFSFIDNPFGEHPFSLSEVREHFLSFFEGHGHSRLHYPETGQRCPVIARWRSDIYLTIASIADFQPHVTSGVVPPPANPLVISQPCIRLNDLDEIGKSGRHLSMFEMMGHHAFNKNVDEIYWKEETVSYCDKFFDTRIGIPRELISYKEQLWDGGGNAGPCLEVLAGGLEIATLVFMNMREDQKGKVNINGKMYAPNPLNIVDTGYGLERIAWISQGTQTVYDTVFPSMISWLNEHANITDDKRSVYSLSDHSKCLAFMLGDGIVPSNVKAGYLARLMIRRSLRFIEQLKLSVSLQELVNMQLDLLEKDFPSLKKHKKEINEVLEIETTRFTETLSKGEGLVKRILAEKGTLDQKDFIYLYDTHGMPPDVVEKISVAEGKAVEIPDHFDSMIAEIHSHEKKEEETQEVRVDLPATDRLYYKDHYTREFDAVVLWKNETADGTEVVLDRTAFYPDGGGQPNDIGIFNVDGRTLSVTQVVKEGDAIVHLVKGPVNVGKKVHGSIDWNRRYSLMKHHTGTHVVNGALRKIFGEHIWQAGSQLGVSEARFDFAHYASISDLQKKEIEMMSNDLLKKQVAVEKKVMARNDAERLFGFRLYQGGVPPGNEIRVLNIPGIDVEACGGTHLNNIKEIEKIRIVKTERISDGVNRIIFTAGKMVDKYQEEEQRLYDRILMVLGSVYVVEGAHQVSDELQKTAKMFSVSVDQLEKTLQRFLGETKKKEGKVRVKSLDEACVHLFEEWKRSQKLKKTVSSDDIKKMRESAEGISGTTVKLIVVRITGDATVVAGALVAEPGYVVHVSDGNKIVSAASEDVSVDLRRIAPAVGKILGGSGGGSVHMTQCGGPKKECIDEALDTAKRLTKELFMKKR